MLENCGAFQIMEFTNHFSKHFGNKTTYHNWFENNMFRKHNLMHPYAFIGIPGLSPGMGFEIMRPNQGFYRSLANMPYADLKVVLRFSTLLGMYTFDEQHQFHVGNKWRNHDFDSIFHNFDFSLRATLPQIM